VKKKEWGKRKASWITLGGQETRIQSILFGLFRSLIRLCKRAENILNKKTRDQII